MGSDDARRMWKVYAGRGAYAVQDFVDRRVVAIGWPELGHVEAGMSREALMDRAKATWPEWSGPKLAAAVGQVHRFLNEIAPGDEVVTYDPGRRVYPLGVIKSDSRWAPEVVNDVLPHVREVEWQAEVQRDLLSAATRNVLGGIATLYEVSPQAAAEIRQVAFEETADVPAGEATDTESAAEAADEATQLDDLRVRSRELIKDAVNALGPYDLQDLVAGLLRAMGYKTRVSAAGPDRGVDVLASPDGFGFEQPRIVVEVKHRSAAMGSQEIRSFLGGRHKDDKGLYVSTGGFTKDARYEADRASIPLQLMDLDMLVDTLIDHYEQIDPEAKALVPLARVYWPAN